MPRAVFRAVELRPAAEAERTGLSERIATVIGAKLDQEKVVLRDQLRQRRLSFRLRLRMRNYFSFASLSRKTRRINSLRPGKLETTRLCDNGTATDVTMLFLLKNFCNLSEA